VESVTALVWRQIVTPARHRPPLLHHALIQPSRKVEEIAQRRYTLRTVALSVPRQAVLMAQRQNNAMTSELQPQHHLVIPSTQRMTQVFDPTPMYASKETE